MLPQDWQVFMEVSQIFILVPALLGLKGNLDMCLASRLSTQANLGNMKSYREVLKMIVGNIALVQVQAIVAATLVSIFATAVSYLTDNSEFSWEHTLLITTSSICTATSSCFILGTKASWVLVRKSRVFMRTLFLRIPVLLV